MLCRRPLSVGLIRAGPVLLGVQWSLFGALLGTGLVAAAIAWQLRGRIERPAGAPAEERLTSTWSLSELSDPLVVARDIDVMVPAGARVLVSGTVTAQAYAAAQVRQLPEVAGDYAVDAQRRKVLLLLGGARANSLALASRDPALVARLAAEAEALWQRAEPYVESRSLADATSRTGLPIAVQGVVTEVIQRQGAFLIRLEEQGQALGVRVQADATELKGQRILVRGSVQREGGYVVLVASDVRRLE